MKSSVLLAISLLMCSCSGHSVGTPQSVTPLPVAPPQASPTVSPEDGPELTGEVQTPTIVGVDPKTGQLLWKAKAKSMEANSGPTGGTGIMQTAVVTLYQHGKPEAIVTAPKVKGDAGNKRIYGSGGVVVKSLSKSQPASARCDSMVWSAATNVMVGTGHVVITVPGTTETGPSFKADTKLESVEIPAPGSGGGTITAHINDLGSRLGQ